MSHEYDYGVFIGRFQPLHIGHEHVIREALSRVGKLILLIGSADGARTPQNPFTYAERITMIQKVFGAELLSGRLLTYGIADRGDDSMWAASVRKAVRHYIPRDEKDSATVALTGFGKDASSYYLEMFPEWESIQIESQFGTLNASDIREDYLRRLPRMPTHAVSTPILAWLHTFSLTEPFRALEAEAAYYRKARIERGVGPFLTADALVLHRGKILLITRGKTPGKGLLAMPGGFVNLDETFRDAALRELEEETGLPRALIEQHETASVIADNPARSLRGRVISQAFFFDVARSAELPPIMGSDDAAHAGWFETHALSPDMLFEDHLEIIDRLLH